MTSWMRRLWRAMRPAPARAQASETRPASAELMDDVRAAADAALVAHRGLRLGTWLPLTDCCPACRASDDWHPDPSGPNGETWMVCEACGFMRDHQGKVAGEPMYVLPIGGAEHE